MLDVFLGFSNSYMIKMPLYHTFNTFLFISLFISYLISLYQYFTHHLLSLHQYQTRFHSLYHYQTYFKKKKKRWRKVPMFNEGLSNYFAMYNNFILLISYLFLNIFEYEVNFFYLYHFFSSFILKYDVDYFNLFLI